MLVVDIEVDVVTRLEAVELDDDIASVLVETALEVLDSIADEDDGNGEVVMPLEVLEETALEVLESMADVEDSIEEVITLLEVLVDTEEELVMTDDKAELEGLTELDDIVLVLVVCAALIDEELVMLPRLEDVGTFDVDEVVDVNIVLDDGVLDESVESVDDDVAAMVEVDIVVEVAPIELLKLDGLAVLTTLVLELNTLVELV